MNELGKALTEVGDPPVQSLVVWNCNPAAVAPNNNLVRRGLAREDLFVVVHEQLMTDTAKYADILLPATSQMEHLDLHFTYGHLYVQLNRPAIEPLGEARPNIDVQNALAKRMGYTESCFDDTAEDIIRQALDTDDPRMVGVTYEYLWEHGFAKIKPDPASGLIENPISETNKDLIPASSSIQNPKSKIHLFRLRMGRVFSRRPARWNSTPSRRSAMATIRCQPMSRWRRAWKETRNWRAAIRSIC